MVKGFISLVLKELRIPVPIGEAYYRRVKIVEGGWYRWHVVLAVRCLVGLGSIFSGVEIADEVPIVEGVAFF